MASSRNFNQELSKATQAATNTWVGAARHAMHVGLTEEQEAAVYHTVLQHCRHTGAAFQALQADHVTTEADFDVVSRENETLPLKKLACLTTG